MKLSIKLIALSILLSHPAFAEKDITRMPALQAVQSNLETSEKMKTIPELLKEESVRQNNTINLIASENYAPESVRAPLSSIAGSKYAEGYPGRRYYGGCEVLDEIERICQKELMNAFVPKEYQDDYHPNVQPHAGSQANYAVFQALLDLGDSVLSMSLNHGGHLTHGHKMNFSGKNYTIHNYVVNEETGLIDYDQLRTLALEHKPKMIICGGSAYSRVIDWKKFRAVADEVGAFLMADIAHIAGLIAAGVHPSPFPYADIVTSTTHKTLRGSRGAFIICRKELKRKIDVNVMPGSQGGPFMHAIASKAVAFKLAQSPEFQQYGQEVVASSKALAQEMMNRGYHVVTNGTDTHLFLIDFSKTPGLEELSGKNVDKYLESTGIVINRNTVPGDKRKPFITSGIRVGLSAMVSRGCTANDMPELATLLDQAIRKTEKHDTLQERVRTFAHKFGLK